ncbi:MAG TPA: AI-2E family transporter [Gaiella sp.]|nr:AI-2E family transporter [Gaiella sp.]
MATPEPPTKRVEITVSARTMATVLGVIAFVWAFIAARQAVLWIFIALFLAIVLTTPVTWLVDRRGMKRGNAAMLVVLGLIGFLGVLAYLLVSPFVAALRDLIEDLPSIVERIRASDLFQELDQRTNLGEELQKRAETLAADLPSKLGDAFEVGGRIFGFGLGALSITFMTLFLVIELPNLSRSLHSVLFPRESHRIEMLEERITRTIGRYALGAMVIAMIAGTVQGTAAWLLGVPFALALGIIAGLLGLIPQVGATIAAVVLSLVALTVGIPQALIMLAVCIGYQQLENYVLQPTIQGRAADISGFFVIASVIVGAALLGVVGALIAVPLVASAQIVIRELTAERRAAVALAHAATPPAGGPRPDA